MLTSSNANEAEVCAYLPKPLKRQGAYGLTDGLEDVDSMARSLNDLPANATLR